MRPGQFISRAAFPVLFALIGLALPASAGAKDKVLSPASYPDTTTYSCRTDAITIHGPEPEPGRRHRPTPTRRWYAAPGGTGVFSPGSTAEGYVTRFQPSMAEIKPGGELVTPSVWDLHLHHVVWIAPDGGPTFASGEEDDRDPAPGLRAQGRRERHLGLNYMIHNLTAAGEARVYVTWTIDWVPVESLGRQHPVGQDRVARRRGTAADLPRVRRRAWVRRRRGRQVRVPGRGPGRPGGGASRQRKVGPRSRVDGSGRRGDPGVRRGSSTSRAPRRPRGRPGRPRRGEVDGDRRSEVKKLFRSAHCDQAGAVSWDVSMEATKAGLADRPEGRRHGLDRRHLRRQAGVVVRVDGDPPAVRRQCRRPEGQGPVRGSQGREEDVREGGILTHGRRPRTSIGRRGTSSVWRIRELPTQPGSVASSGIQIDNFRSSLGGYTAGRDSSARCARPGSSPATPSPSPAWTRCRRCPRPSRPGTRSRPASHPATAARDRLPARGRAGQVRLRPAWLRERRELGGDDRLERLHDAPLTKPGGTYTCFRIHPFMRARSGSREAARVTPPQ